MYAHVFFPHYCTKEWNEFHEEYFKTTRQPGRGMRNAWASPRGSAKSVLVSLIDCLHDVCYELEHFIVLISNTDDLAVAKLKDIQNEALSNGMLASVYGLYFAEKRPGTSAFTLRKPGHQTHFMAFGRGAQIRGVRYGPHRPSKVVIDDMEHSERVYSEKLREKDLAYLREDVLKCGNEETNYQAVGTILHRQSVLAQLMVNPLWKARKFQSIKEWPERMDLWQKWEEIYMRVGDEDRQRKARQFYLDHQKQMDAGAVVMWPDKEPLYYLMEERLEIGHRSFMKEKQNDPMGSEDRVFDRILWYQERGNGLYVEHTKELIEWKYLQNNAYGTLDPATGQTKPSQSKRSDFACLVTGYSDPKGRVLVHDDWTKRRPPSAQIDQIFQKHDQFNYEKFGVETNLYRNLILEVIQAEKKRIETREKRLLKIPFYDIESTENKDRRIHRLEPKVHHGWILFNRSLSQEFMNQIEDYPSADHDDAPDALEMLWGLVHNRFKAAGHALHAMSGR